MKNRIKELRADQKWSQADLAMMVGVSRQAINAVETGKHDPSLLLAFNIAHAFNLAIEEIFDPQGLTGS
ncbi:MAG: helix-turn-helix transcriptional regulator [Pseudomonadota bacterium]